MFDGNKGRIDESDFERMFKYEKGLLPDIVKTELKQTDTSYDLPSSDDLAEYTLNVLKLCEQDYIARDKKQNLAVFENGWSQNLNKLKSGNRSDDFINLKPGYFRDSRFFRYNNQLILPTNRQLEFQLFTIARYCMFHKFISPYKKIYELGCGSCQNMLMLSNLYPDKDIFGLDWTESSTKIAQFLAKKGHHRLSAERYDLLSSQPLPEMDNDTAILSIHAFEQLGDNYNVILDKMIASDAGLVVQLEPVLEFYNQDYLLDYLAVKYSTKRQYLNGYYTALQRKADQGEIEIIQAFRPYLGGILHEASLLIWKPTG